MISSCKTVLRQRHRIGCNLSNPFKVRQLQIGVLRSRNFTSHEESNLGLYGTQELFHYSDFGGLAYQAVKKSEAFRSKVYRTSHQASDAKQACEVVEALDGMSKALCDVLDLVELCEQTHPEQRWRTAARQVNDYLSDYILKVNMDYKLYAPLAQNPVFSAISGSPQTSPLDDRVKLDKTAISELKETLQVGKSLKQEFERDGIHLSEAFPEKAQQVREMKRIVVKLEQAYLQAISRRKGGATIRTLAELLTARQHLATALGFNDYSHLQLSYKMIKRPSTVVSLLNELEIELNRSMAAAPPVTLSAVRANTLFIPLHTVLRYMSHVSETLFGLRLQLVAAEDATIWERHVLKMELFHSSSQQVDGLLFLDLHPRREKTVSAAHFQIKTATRMGTDSGGTSGVTYEMPVSAIVASFPSLSSSKGLTSSLASFYQKVSGQQFPSPVQRIEDDKLSFVEVRSLFHEFGHALHSLLSRTKYQHLSGTRGELDFAEFPSTLFEKFLTDESLLETFDATLAKDIKQVKAPLKRHQLQALQEQIVQAKMDLLIHSEEFAHQLTQLSSASSIQDHFTQAFKACDPMGRTSKHNFLLDFSHLVNYGSCYYSYVLAKLLSADVYESCFAKKTCAEKRRAGALLHEKILKVGGTRDPTAMIEALLERQYSSEALLREFSFK